MPPLMSPYELFNDHKLVWCRLLLPLLALLEKENSERGEDNIHLHSGIDLFVFITINVKFDLEKASY